MRFQRICGGSFQMGSKNDAQSLGKETPVHEVKVAGFWMGQTEVTNAQYRTFKPDHDADKADDLPVVDVSWIDARDYCRSLGPSESWVYDLPTEAEWEYAARAGTTTALSFGDRQEAIGEYAWFAGNSQRKAQPVATKEPNSWGLHDVHGNVWEWVLNCYEDYAEYADPNRATADPGLIPDSCHQSGTPGALRVLRGGAFVSEPRLLRSAIRIEDEPVYSNWDVGFRCVRRAVDWPRSRLSSPELPPLTEMDALILEMTHSRVNRDAKE